LVFGSFELSGHVKPVLLRSPDQVQSLPRVLQPQELLLLVLVLRRLPASLELVLPRAGDPAAAPTAFFGAFHLDRAHRHQARRTRTAALG